MKPFSDLAGEGSGAGPQILNKREFGNIPRPDDLIGLGGCPHQEYHT